MAPQRILLMRHAEKSGDPLDENLAPAGVARAARLATYIPATFGKTGFLFATAASKHSLRPIQTIQPLSTAINVPINASFADQDYGALAQEILANAKYDGAFVLICWHHGNIPPLANALGAGAGSCPNPWDSAVFNLILQFDYGVGAPTVTAIVEPF